MANKKYKLTDGNYWATDGVYDFDQGKTQREVNSDLIGAISDAATTNLLDTFTKTNETVSGVTITWLGDGSVKANGTSSATEWNTVYQSTTQMPSGIVAGQTYKASMKTTYEKLYLMILAYTGSWTTVLNTASSTPVSFTVPSNATGLYIRVNIQGGYTFSNDIAKPVIYASDALRAYIGDLLGGLSFKMFSMSGGKTATLTFASKSNHAFIFTSGAYVAARSIMVVATSSTGVAADPSVLVGGEGVTMAKNANTISITNGTNAMMVCGYMLLAGDIPTITTN